MTRLIRLTHILKNFVSASVVESHQGRPTTNGSSLYSVFFVFVLAKMSLLAASAGAGNATTDWTQSVPSHVTGEGAIRQLRATAGGAGATSLENVVSKAGLQWLWYHHNFLGDQPIIDTTISVLCISATWSQESSN